VVKRCGIATLNSQDDLAEDQHPPRAQNNKSAGLTACDGDRTARRPAGQSALSTIRASAGERQIAENAGEMA
jgi:hypothetical protein